MRCPTLSELPPPPPDKTGWPWTKESPQLPDSGQVAPRPRVSVVTPSYNQGQFIEETFRSVLLQGYPSLEYIVVDGGSTDGTLDVLRRYEGWLSWISEPDEGQADAINKGFKQAQGEIVGWLNSDDIYMPGTVAAVVDFMAARPDVVMVYGDYLYIDRRGRPTGIGMARPFNLKDALFGTSSVPQPGSFYRRAVFDQVGFLDASLHFIMDHELLLRIGRRFKISPIPRILAGFRKHPASKTTSLQDLRAREITLVLEEVFSDTTLPPELRKLKRQALESWYTFISPHPPLMGRRTRAFFSAVVRAVFYSPAGDRRFDSLYDLLYDAAFSLRRVNLALFKALGGGRRDDC